MYRRINKIDIVIPVYNEEVRLQEHILYLHNYLKGLLGTFLWNIIIVDNASIDQTAKIGENLSRLHPEIQYRRIPRKGRGLALRETFLDSSADVVCYMDVDLSTNLRYFMLFIAGIECGFDICIGSRLMQGSRVRRRLKREIFSRIYNAIIKILFFNRFSDAQCGFKAIRTDVVKSIMPLIKNNNWFFDTELLLIAEYNKLRIFEIPVEWIDDLKSKVHIGKTITEDLLGLFRMRFSLHHCRIFSERW